MTGASSKKGKGHAGSAPAAVRTILDVPTDPVPKPRMTQRDRWHKRHCVLRYRAFCDTLRLYAREPLPEAGIHIVLRIPMPQSWSRSKRDRMRGQGHRPRPDRDNLEKAVLDALMPEDSTQWDARISKIWAERGRVTVYAIEPPRIPVIAEADRPFQGDDGQ